MPGRPPKTTALHILQGTARKGRLAKRAGEMLLEPGALVAPDWLLPEALIHFQAIIADRAYSRALATVDAAALARYCQLHARYVEAERKDKPLVASMVSVLTILEGKLGLNPSDRVKVRVPEEPMPVNRFAQLDRLYPNTKNKQEAV
jgi:phage terminase small subunit